MPNFLGAMIIRLFFLKVSYFFYTMYIFSKNVRLMLEHYNSVYCGIGIVRGGSMFMDFMGSLTYEFTSPRTFNKVVNFVAL